MKRIEVGIMPKSWNPDIINICDCDAENFGMTINGQQLKNVAEYSFGNDGTFRTLTVTITEPLITINAE